MHWRPLLLRVLVLATIAFIPACSGRKTQYPATGKVLLDGKPTPGAIVWLHPEPPTAPNEPRPHGVVDEHGDFALSTFDTGDGAPAGTYRVSVCWYKKAERGDDIGSCLLPIRYQDPKTAGLPTVEIAPQTNTIALLKLTR